MKILLFSTLYPNSAQPLNALFVEQRLLQLRKDYPELEVKVVAPVPWFPSTNERFGEYATFASVPREEVRNGITISHPRFPVIPKVGMSLAPFLMAIWIFLHLRSIKRNGFDFDVIDAHFLYPDGIAATLLGQWLNKPVVITARGSDIMLHQQYAIPRWITRRFIGSAQTLICVAGALRDFLQEREYPLPDTRILRNGVDLELFQERNRDDTRKALGLEGTVLISAGRLAELKGLDLTITALQDLPDATLLLVGAGPEEQRLKQIATDCGVADRVIFLGGKAQNELPDYFSAADIQVLASSREGWPNVLLESMACGTPVVATNVGGVPEVLGSSRAGVLVSERSADGLAAGIRQMLEHYPDRTEVRSYAEQFDWRATSDGQYQVFQRAIEVHSV